MIKEKYAKLTSWFYGISISKRIQIVFILVISIMSMMIMFLSSNEVKKIMIENQTNITEYELSLLERNIYNLEADTNKVSNNFTLWFNDNILEYNDLSKFNTQDKIHEQLMKELIVNTNIQNITFFKDDNYITSILTADIFFSGELKHSDILDSMEISSDSVMWCYYNYDFTFNEEIDDYYNEKLLYIKIVRNIQTLEPVGILVIEPKIKQLFSDNTDKIYNEYVVISSNSIIYSTDDSYYDLGVDSKVDKDKYRSSIVNLSGSDFHIISLSDVDRIDEIVNDLYRNLLPFFSVILVISILLTYRFSKTITQPITSLTKHIKSFTDGELVKYKKENIGGETGQLIKTFNRMIDSNNELLKRIDYEQSKKTEYQLAVLNSQIKPHFLYNTLDSIVRLAGLNRNEEVISTAINIAKFYRISLSGGDEFIPISKELALTKSYLEMLRIRYDDVFDFEFNIPENLDEVLIPKLIFQPIVENSIYHGLKPKDKKGKIILNVIENDDYLITRIYDNGVGMNKETIDRILNDGLKDSYALSNVNKRLWLYYKEKYELSIKSEIGQYSIVEIKIEKRKNHV